MKYQITSFESAQAFIDKLDADDKKFVAYPVRNFRRPAAAYNTLNTRPDRTHTTSCSMSPMA